MPSPASGFFGGLAEGIFGRMREHEDEQRKQDLEQKRQTLSYLTSLMDQTTPETRPILFQQISNVMGLKGKQRGVWDMLTGRGRQNYSDALGQKLSEITGSIVGQDQFNRLKNTKVLDGLSGSAPGGFPIPTGHIEDRSAGKIALRDPQAEELSQLEARYNLIGQQKYRDLQAKEEALLGRQLRVQEEAQKDRLEIAETQKYNKAFGKVYEQAAVIAAQKGKQRFDDDDLAEAAGQVAALGGLSVDKLKAQIGLLGAKQKQAEFESTLGPDGRPLGKPMTEAQEASQSRGLTQDAISAFGKFKENRAKFVELDSQFRADLQNLQTMLASRNLYYKDGVIYESGTNQPAQGVPSRLQEAAKKVNELRTKAQNFQRQAGDDYKVLQNTYGDMFSDQGFYGIEPNPNYRSPGVTSIGERIPPFPKTSTTPSSTWKQAPSNHIGEVVYILLPTVPKATEPLEMWGQTYQVLGVEGKQGKYNKVRVKRIK